MMSLLGRQSFPCSTACFGQSTVHRAAGDPQGVSDVLNSHVAGIVGVRFGGCFRLVFSQSVHLSRLAGRLNRDHYAASSRYACKPYSTIRQPLAQANLVPVAAVRKQRNFSCPQFFQTARTFRQSGSNIILFILFLTGFCGMV